MDDLPAGPSPLWAAPGDRRPPLDRDVDADVVVVGGGIAGLTAAVLLSRGGARVVVLEAGAAGRGTTGASTAKVTALQATRLSLVRDRHGADVAARYVAAQVTGLDWIVERAARRGAAVALERRDAVTYCTSDDMVVEIEAEARAARAAGLPVELVDEVAELPFPVRRAVRLGHQAQLDPRAWCDDLAAELDERPGAVVHEGTRVTGIDARGRHVTTADGHVVRAGHIVLATLLPISDRGAFFAQVEPAMSHGIAITLRTPVASTFPMAYGAGEPSRSLRTAVAPDGRPVLIVLGGGHVVGRHPATLDEASDLLTWARRHFPVEDVTHRWAAHDLRPIDELPFAGRADRLPGAPWVTTGFAKWGLTNGTAAAMTVAGRILGDDGREWDDDLDPRRSRGLSGLRRAAALNGSVGWELAWGWARPDASTGRGGPRVERRAGVPCGSAPPPADGDPCALSLVCTHLGGIVRWNEAEETWDCPLHGSRFADDGTVVAGPASRPLHRHGSPPADGDGPERRGDPSSGNRATR